MDEASITIRFKDESSPAGSGVATTSPQYSGSDPGSVKVADQQNAITQAGGVGPLSERNNRASDGGQSPAIPAPVQPAIAPPAAPVGPGAGDPLLNTVQELVNLDPRATAAEIARSIQIPLSRAQDLLASTIQPGGQAAPQQPSTPLPAAPAGPPPAQPPVPTPAPPPVQTAPGGPTVPRPPELTIEQVLDQAQHRAPPLLNPPPPEARPDPGHGVQNAVDSIARLGHFAGPVGSLAGQTAQTVVAQAGMAAGIAQAAPALAAVAPYVAAIGGAVVLPVAAASVVQNALDRAAGQIGGLSPEVAMAAAQANVAQMMANLRTARDLGDEVADNIRIRNRAQIAQQGFRDVVAEPIFQEWNDIANGLTSASEGLTKFAQENKELFQGFIRGVISASAGMFPGAAEIRDYLRRLNERMDREEVTGSLLDIFPTRPAITGDKVFGKDPNRTSGLSAEFGMF